MSSLTCDDVIDYILRKRGHTLVAGKNGDGDHTTARQTTGGSLHAHSRPQAQEVSFFDLERVEVLRGPQGTLYGRNTTAGLVNVITATPKHAFEGSVDAVYASFDTIQLTGVVNVPVNDKVAVRAAINYD